MKTKGNEHLCWSQKESEATCRDCATSQCAYAIPIGSKPKNKPQTQLKS